MSLFQCDECGCMENTALPENYWDRHSEKKKELCSECESGKWHGEFKRVYLPKSKFKTNREGNLEHIDTGSTDFMKYAKHLTKEIK